MKNKTLQYVRDVLSCGNQVGRSLAKRISESSVVEVYLIPSTVNLCSLKSARVFRDGGVAGRETSIDRLVEQIGNVLQEDDKSFLMEHALAKPSDSCLDSRKDVLLSLCGQVYYCFREQNRVRLKAIIRKVASSFHFAGFVVSDVLNIEMSFEEIVDSISLVVVGAFDGEGFVLCRLKQGIRRSSVSP